MKQTLAALSATNIKGRSFEHALSPVTVFTGPNRAGKSARLDALRLALWRVHPQLGKTNPALFKLASDSTMTAAVTMADGSRVERTLFRKKDGSVSAKEEGLNALTGLSDAPLIGSEFITRTDGDQMAALFKAANIEFSPTALRKLADAVFTEKARESGSDMDPFADWDQILHTSVIEAFKEATPEEKASGQRWLENSITRLKKLLNEAEAEARVAKHAVQALEEEASKADPEKRLSSVAVEAAKDNVRALGEDIARREGELEQRKAEFQSALLRAEEYQQQLATMEAQFGSLTARSAQEIEAELQQVHTKQRTALAQYNAEYESWREGLEVTRQIPELRTRLQAARERRAELNNIQLPDLEAAQQSARDLTEKAESLAYELTETQEDRTAICNRIHKLTADLQEWRRELESLDTADHCPTCLAATQGWKDRVTHLLSEKVEYAEAKLSSCNTKERELAGLRESLVQQHGAAMQLATEAAQRVIQARAQHEHHSIDVQEADAAIESAAARLRTLEKRAESEGFAPAEPLRPDTEALRARICELQAEQVRRSQIDALDAVRRNPPVAVDEPDWEALDRELWEAHQALEAEQKGLAEMESEYAEQHGREKNLWAQRYNYNEARAKVVTLTAVVNAVVAERDRLVNEAIVPILATVNRLCGGILEHRVEYMEGEIGYENNGSFVALRCFSGAEQAVFTAAMQVALAATYPVKIAIVDELSRLDAMCLSQFLANVEAAIRSGRLHQFIGATCANVPQMDGVTHVWVG